MVDRTINFGADDTEATYQIQDDDPNGGGNFAINDLDAATAILEYDQTSDTWSVVDINVTTADITTADITTANTTTANVTTLKSDDITDTSDNKMLQGVVASGQATLSSNLAEVATGISTTDATFMLALGIDDPDADAEVAGALYWDDAADEYKVRIRETETDVNPTVNYDIVRVR